MLRSLKLRAATALKLSVQLLLAGYWDRDSVLRKVHLLKTTA